MEEEREVLVLDELNKYIKELLANKESVLASSIDFKDDYEKTIVIDSICYYSRSREAVYTIEKIYKKNFYLIDYPFDIKISLKVIHELKIKKEYYIPVSSWQKQFELRKLDRDYQVGHFIKFNVINEDGTIEPSNDIYRITYILKDVPEYGLQPGFGILGITRVY